MYSVVAIVVLITIFNAAYCFPSSNRPSALFQPIRHLNNFGNTDTSRQVESTRPNFQTEQLRSRRSTLGNSNTNFNIPGAAFLRGWYPRWLGEEAYNKWVVLKFYQEVFGDKNVDAADKYIDEKIYIQHNPHVADGREAFKKAARDWFHDAPKEKIEFKRIGADGDLVWVHTKSMDEGHVQSVIDIFKLHCGKIIEHWDVMQRVPEVSANAHPMF